MRTDIICAACRRIDEINHAKTRREGLRLEREIKNQQLKECPSKQDGYNNCYDRSTVWSLTSLDDSNFLLKLSKINFCSMTDRMDRAIRARLVSIANRSAKLYDLATLRNIEVPHE